MKINPPPRDSNGEEPHPVSSAQSSITFQDPRTLPFRDTGRDMRFGYKDNNTKSLADEGKIRKLAGLELE